MDYYFTPISGPKPLSYTIDSTEKGKEIVVVTSKISLKREVLNYMSINFVQIRCVFK